MHFSRLSPGIKGYELYDMISHSVFHTWDVAFNEKDFHFKNDPHFPFLLHTDTTETPSTSSSQDDFFLDPIT